MSSFEPFFCAIFPTYLVVMPPSPSLQVVGSIVKSKNLNGEVKVVLEDFFLDFLSENPAPEHFFLEKKGQFVPYFLERWQVGHSETIAKFEGVHSRNDAELLRGSALFVEKTLVAPYQEAANEEGWFFLIGYALHDNDGTLIGIIEDIFSLPHNDLAQVKHTPTGSAILVPLNEELVELLDEDQKIVVMNLPDGLVELYLPNATE